MNTTFFTNKKKPFRNIQKKSKKGFTLIEIMVSVSIFTIIMTVGMGALVSMVRNYQVTQQQKKVHDGLNYALESMVREIRLGKNYLAGANPGGGYNGAQNDSIGFISSDARGNVIYYLDNDAIFVKRTGGTNGVNGTYLLTDDSQIVIEDVQFTVIGTETFANGDFQQPLVWIKIKAHPKNSTRETVVQTLVSQRILDA